MGVGELKSKSQNVGCWQQILCQASFSKQDPCLFGRQAASVLTFFPSFARLQAVEVEGIILHVSRFLYVMNPEHLHLGLSALKWYLVLSYFLDQVTYLPYRQLYTTITTPLAHCIDTAKKQFFRSDVQLGKDTRKLKQLAKSLVLPFSGWTSRRD